jgi:hypothetical protein
MTDDGRLLVLLGLVGVAAASAVRGSRGIVRYGRPAGSNSTTRAFRVLVMADAWARRDHLVSLVDGIGSSRSEGAASRPTGRVAPEGIGRVFERSRQGLLPGVSIHAELDEARAFALEWSDQLGGCEVWEWGKKDGSRKIREARKTARFGPFRLVRLRDMTPEHVATSWRDPRRPDYALEVWTPTWPIPGHPETWNSSWRSFQYIKDPYRSQHRPEGDLEQVLSDLVNPKPTTTFKRGGLIFEGEPPVIRVFDKDEAKATVEVAP